MKKITFLFQLLLMLGATLVLKGQSSLEKQLFELPDIIFEEMATPPGFQAAYELRVKQPIDHKDPYKGYFYQRGFLSHQGVDRPTVIITEGYIRSSNRVYELSTFLNANQVTLEHRYFGASKPDSLDYRYLTTEQATADLHHLNTLLKNIYNQEPWVSSGISRGGQMTIMYRYFYPNDVTASVPYVAPLTRAYEDTRIYDFLDTIGTDECRQKIRNFQVRLLKKREEALTRLKWYAKGQGQEFSYFTLEEAFEYAVMEYPFSFWQIGHDCSEIPGKSEHIDDMLDHFNKVVGLGLYSDAEMERYGSHYYVAATEFGYYGFETKPFRSLLKVLPDKPHAAFVPGKMNTTFSSKLMDSVSDWLAKEGDNFIYIYGAIDTWTATAVPENKETNSLWFMMEGKDHINARIANMSSQEKKLFRTTLEKWLDMDISR